MAEAGEFIESREIKASLDNTVRPQLKIYLCAHALVTHIGVCACAKLCVHRCVLAYVCMDMDVMAWTSLRLLSFWLYFLMKHLFVFFLCWLIS